MRERFRDAAVITALCVFLWIGAGVATLGAVQLVVSIG